MNFMRSRSLLLLGVTAVMMVMFAMPAAANHIDSATANATCTGYTINFKGAELDVPGATYVVAYSITVTPQSGSPVTIAGSVPVTPDAQLKFDVNVMKLWSDHGLTLNGSYSFSGQASLVV